jgi:hypothetical protein
VQLLVLDAQVALLLLDSLGLAARGAGARAEWAVVGGGGVVVVGVVVVVFGGGDGGGVGVGGGPHKRGIPHV